MKKALVGVALALVACGGGAKDAASPGTCPEGTVLKGSDCLPGDAAGGGGDDSPRPAHKKKSDDEGGGGGGDSSASASPGSSAGSSYDKDAVDAQLRRAAKQIKANCGSATDDEGKATGPWGTIKASVVLGRNGHVKHVTVPDPYAGKPVGICVDRALQKVVFPPYAGSDDVPLDWDFDVVKPK